MSAVIPKNSAADQSTFCQFYFDPSQHAFIGGDGKTIKLRSKSLEVFLLLLNNADEVVTKKDILDTVWNGLTVTDDSVTQCVVDLRRVLGTQHRSLLQTVPRIGYRLCLGADELGHPVICPLSIQPTIKSNKRVAAQLEQSHLNGWRKTNKLNLRSRSVGNRCYAVIFGLLILAAVVFFDQRWRGQIPVEGKLSQKGPTLAVLPFKSNDALAVNDNFSDGITEDITAHLSRYSDIGLVSWETVSSRSADAGHINAVAEEFGVRYLLTGSVRHDNTRVRVAVRLSDARSGRLLWSDRYDEKLHDIFLIQDRISKNIVATLAVRLTEIETELSRLAPTRNMAAYQLSLLGRHELRKRTRNGNFTARQYFTESIELDSNFSDAYIRLGETYLEEAMFGWTEWPDQSIKKAQQLGKKAIELGGKNARSLSFLALVNLRLGDYARAQAYLDRAFAFNTEDPSLHEIQGLLHLWNGKADQAIDHLEYVLRYDPYSTLASSHLFTAYYVVGRAADAVATIERLFETAPDAKFSHIILTAAFVELNEIDSAKAAAAVIRRQHPFLTAASASEMRFFSSEATKTRFINSLRKAGIE